MQEQIPITELTKEQLNTILLNSTIQRYQAEQTIAVVMNEIIRRTQEPKIQPIILPKLKPIKRQENVSGSPDKE